MPGKKLYFLSVVFFFRRRGSASGGLRLLSWISALVLLVACANIANLLLSRGAARRAETSIRTALGAARAALIGQSLAESVSLAVAGGIIGIGIAYLGARMILSLAFPEATQMPIQASPSLVILGFAFCCLLSREPSSGSCLLGSPRTQIPPKHCAD
jgi:ABC-type antimicrobial peptide transport system permease subunit